MRLRSVFPIVVCLLTVACAGSNPLSPSGNNSKYADLTLRLDAACAGVRTMSADTYIDGQFVATVKAGSSTTQTVTVGQHFVEAHTYFVATGARAGSSGPTMIDVPKAGFTYLFYC